MIPALKAEFRKLVTVRSTYVVIAFSVFVVFLEAGYTEGFKARPEMLHNSGQLATEVVSAISALAVFAALVSILQFSHEYRYNTIIYSLTSSNSRSKVLLAKILVMTGFATVFALLIGVLSPIATAVGIKLAGHDLVAQSIPYMDLLWHGLFFCWGFAMFGLLLVALIRNQVFAIVTIFFIPVIESIGGIVLKHDAVYLPFTALGAVMNKNPDITPQKAVIVFMIYLVSWWITAWLLFLRRDATNSRS